MKARGVFARVVKELDPKKFDELRKRFAAGRHQVNVGFPGGEDHGGSDLTVAQVARIHEFGAPSAGIPERPFLRVAIDKNRGKYVRINRESVLGMSSGRLSMEQALGRLGVAAKADVQVEITTGNFAPLKPETIARKGSSKPLIDSGQMRQSVTWEIEK